MPYNNIFRNTTRLTTILSLYTFNLIAFLRPISVFRLICAHAVLAGLMFSVSGFYLYLLLLLRFCVVYFLSYYYSVICCSGYVQIHTLPIKHEDDWQAVTKTEAKQTNTFSGTCEKS